MVNTSLFDQWKQSTDNKEKRLLEYLHIRLNTIQKRLLPNDISPTPSSQTKKESVQEISSLLEARALISKITSVEAKPLESTMQTTVGISSLGIDFSHPILNDFDYTQSKRFPRSITIVLKGFTQAIVDKIHSTGLSVYNQDALYTQLFSVLDTQIYKTTDIKEKKILQYIRNYTYMNQQEEKMSK